MQYLRDYDPTWPQWFQWIERYLSPRLGKFVCVEHVGSTSIVGMAAKPIIDLDVVVQDGTMIQTIATIEAAGYRHQGDLGLPGREAFEQITDTTRALPPHHLYACEISSLELRKHRSFRDYLRTHPLEAHRLTEHKRELVFKGRLSRGEYQDAKSLFVSALAADAMAWYSTQGAA